MDYSVKDFYVPTITYFTSGNKLTGSCTGMNYKMTPIKDKEILVQVWYGPMNLEHSELGLRADLCHGEGEHGADRELAVWTVRRLSQDAAGQRLPQKGKTKERVKGKAE